MRRLREVIAFPRSACGLLAALFVVALLLRLCRRPSLHTAPAATEAGRVEAPAPLVPHPEAVTVAHRIDSATVAVDRVAVEGARRYAATVTVEAGSTGVVLGVRRARPGWFSEFRLQRPDPVAVDLLPGFEAEVLTVDQRLPVFDVEVAPQAGLGVDGEGVSGVVAVTVVRAWGVHLGGFAAVDLRPRSGRRRLRTGGYASIRPRPAVSLGLGVDGFTHSPLVALTLNL
jgi:hypothetical protein